MLKRFFLTIAILPIAMPLLWSDDKSSNRGKETPVLLNKNKRNQKPPTSKATNSHMYMWETGYTSSSASIGKRVGRLCLHRLSCHRLKKLAINNPLHIMP